MRLILLLIGVAALLTGATAFLAPMMFYTVTPGLEQMGPFNLHFIKDVGLAFIASGAAMTWGAWRRNRSIAIAGAAWPAMHGLFHVSIQISRGLPSDFVMWFDVLAIIAPAFLALYAAINLKSAADNLDRSERSS